MNTQRQDRNARAYRQGLVAAGLTVGVPVLAAILLPTALVWPLALVAPFVGMTSLEALLEHEGLLARKAA